MSIKKNVDVQPGVGVPAIFHCSQGDKGTRIILGLLNNNDNYTIPEGTTAIIRGSRADGTLFTEITADIDTTTEIKFNLTEDMTSVAGLVECEAVMTSGSANVIGTANFIINVEKSPASVGSVFPGTDAAETWLIDELTNLGISGLDDESVVDAINGKLGGTFETTDAGKVLMVNQDGTVSPAAVDLSGKASESTIAPEFDPSGSYTAGQYVYKNGVLYKFTQSHSGAWTGSDAVAVTVGGEVEETKSLTIPALYGNVGSDFPLEFENGTYHYTTTGKELEKFYGSGYNLTRKVIKTTTFDAPCEVQLKAKTGYEFRIFLARNGVITADTGIISEYTMSPGQQYGMILKSTNGNDDISAVKTSDIIEINYIGKLNIFEKQVTALENVVIAEYDLTLKTTIKTAISPSTGKWASNVNYACYYFSVPTGTKIARIKSNAINGTIYALLSASDTHTSGDTPSYATGCVRTFIEAGEEKIIIIPDDCKYIWIAKTLTGGTDYNPQFLGFNMSIPQIDNTLTKQNEAAESKTVGDNFKKIIPISIEYSSTDGSYIIYGDGNTYNGSNFAYSDYIDIDGIAKITYDRIIVPSGYNPRHGIAFYDSNKEFIEGSGVKSLSSGNKSGYIINTTTVPNGAKYVRCTMWDDSFSQANNIDKFIILDNEDYEKTILSRVENINNEFSSTAILHTVPQSAGVQNAILTARQFTDIMWTPLEDMPGIIYDNSEYVYRTHKKGCRQKGIPYGSGLSYSQMVGDTISFDAFATAVKSVGSVLYTNNAYVEGGKKASYYGVACSKLVQSCWGAPELVDSQQIFKLPGITKIADPGEYTFDDIELCDGIIKPNEHCTIVTDIIRSAVTRQVVAIEISEAVTPTCRRLLWSKGEFEKHFGSYSLYRYSYIENAKYNKARYVDLDDGFFGVDNIPFAIRRGSFINMASTSSYKADIDNTRWTTLHDIVNGVEQALQISSSEMTIPKDRTGYHEVYPTDTSNNRGNSSYYYVYELTVSGSVSDGSITVNYTITDGAKPWVIVFDPYNYTFITEDTGAITVEIPSGMTSCYVLFKSDYGTIQSSTISLTT